MASRRPRGQRSLPPPHLDPLARGVLFGLTARHSRAHVVRAILEGVAFSLRDGLEILLEMGVPVRQVRASGGGGRSPLWRQIQADVFDRELVTINAGEGSAYGAALLAAAVRTESLRPEVARRAGAPRLVGAVKESILGPEYAP